MLRGQKLNSACPISMVSPSKPLDQIQPNFVCECSSKKILAPSSGEGSKGKISFNFNYNFNFKDFYTKLCVFPKFDCVVSSRREFVCDADAESLSLSDIWLR